MVDLNLVCDQQLRQNDKAIITVFTEGGFGITFQVQQQRAKLEI